MVKFLSVRPIFSIALAQKNWTHTKKSDGCKKWIHFLGTTAIGKMPFGKTTLGKTTFGKKCKNNVW
jgi:hypothetical protein